MALLETRSISQRFGGLQALRDVSLSVDGHEIVGIIGPNGAGKSTLFNAIVGLIAPTAGQVLFAGEDITGQPSHAVVARGLIKTSQTAQVFGEMTVMENVLVGAMLHTPNLRAARVEAMNDLAFLGLAEHANRPAQDLTLANRAYLELARALATRPRLLMVDELMAGLTELEVSQTLDALRTINQERGIALMVIEHNMQAIMRLSHRVIAMEQGSIVAEGDGLTVSRDPRVIEAYLGVGDSGTP